MGYPVGVNSDGATGYCYGVPPDQATLDAAHIEHHDSEDMAAGYWDTAPAFFTKLPRSLVQCGCAVHAGPLASVEQEHAGRRA